MQRKFLEDLGLEKETVDKIMAENGSDIEKTKSILETERDSYKEQLETAQNALKEFEGIDVKELNGKIAQLTADMAAKDAEHQAKIADMEFNSVLDTALTASKARNSKAVKAENDYLFTSDEPIMNAVRGTGTPPQGKKMTLTEAMKYANAHPDVDVKTLI